MQFCLQYAGGPAAESQGLALSIQKWVSSRTAIPNLFGTRDQFCGRQFFHEPGRGGWFQDDLSTLLSVHVLYTFFLLLLHRLHLKSSGIRSQRLGTPSLEPKAPGGS